MEAKTFKIGNTTIIIRATTPREIVEEQKQIYKEYKGEM